MLKVVRMRVMDFALKAADEEAQRLTGAASTSGSGYFSTCYVGNGCAVKVIANVSADGYIPYIKAVAPIMGKNPHVPNVWKVIVFDDGEQEAAIVQMEVLAHSSRWYDEQGRRRSLAGDKFCDRTLRSWRRGERTPPTAAWQEVWDIVQELRGSWGLDLHSGNIMRRGTTWVLTDPLSFPK